MKLALLFLLAAAEPGQQFNLVCTGTVETVRLGGVDSAPYTRTLRVDLGAGQWCADDCGSVEPIERVEPGRITFRSVRRDTPREYRMERESVNRVTGEHSSTTESGLDGPVPRSAFSAGHCEKAEFTGFVQGPTKF